MNNMDYSELVLNSNESINFINNLLHPNPDTLQRGRDFLSALDQIEVIFHDGVITAECPDITLPDDESILYQARVTVKMRNDSALIVKRNNNRGAFCTFFERTRTLRSAAVDLFSDGSLNNVDGIPDDPIAA